MNYTEEIFIKLMANCICKEKVLKEIDYSKLDSDRLVYLSRVNTVSAIVYSAIKEFDDVPRNLLESLKNEFMKTVLKISKYNTVLDLAVDRLSDAGFPYALVKGKTIAKYYPSEELRDMSDLDILVKKEDFEIAKKLFNDFCGLKPRQVDNEYEISYMLNGVTIELQNNLAYEKNLSGEVDYEDYFNDLINKRVLDGKISVIEPSHSFVYNIYHMAQHFYYTGCGVRMIIDIAVMIKHFENEFDWDEIIQVLKSSKLYEFATNVFNIIDKWFGIKVPNDKIEKREVLEECEQYFINAGIFGRANINSDVGNIRKNDSYLKWAFPSYSHMRQYNDWFKKKPAILLPLAYVLRMTKGMRERGGMVKGVSVVGQTKKDYDKHKKIVEQMGL